MMKEFKKKLLFTLATKLGWLFLLILGRLTRIELINRKYWLNLKRKNARVLFLIWHGRILLPIYIHRGEGITAMVSEHSDGEMVAQILHRLGYGTIRGSSSRGGKRAFHEMVAALKQGLTCVIIPDGPRGPRHKLKPGAIYLAQQSGAHLVPVTFSSSRRIQIKSWDRFTIMKPFSRSAIFYGEPVLVPPNANEQELEQLRLDLEKKMIQLENQADEYFRK